jgi:hypothetical protein
MKELLLARQFTKIKTCTQFTMLKLTAKTVNTIKYLWLSKGKCHRVRMCSDVDKYLKLNPS